jgi:hypothetical protein
VARKYEGMTVAGNRRARAAGDYFILVKGGGARVVLVKVNDEPPPGVRSARRRGMAGGRGAAQNGVWHGRQTQKRASGCSNCSTRRKKRVAAWVGCGRKLW